MYVLGSLNMQEKSLAEYCSGSGIIRLEGDKDQIYCPEKCSGYSTKNVVDSHGLEAGR